MKILLTSSSENTCKFIHVGIPNVMCNLLHYRNSQNTCKLGIPKGPSTIKKFCKFCGRVRKISNLGSVGVFADTVQTLAGDERGCGVTGACPQSVRKKCSSTAVLVILLIFRLLAYIHVHDTCSTCTTHIYILVHVVYKIVCRSCSA